MLNKKAISPVVAIALLLVVAVVAVVGFQNWYAGFQSGLETDVEQRSNAASGSVNVEFISSDGIIYITNTGSGNVSMSTIKIGDTDCNLNKNLTPGVNNISVSSCLNNTGTNNIMIVTENGIIQESLFVEEFIPPPPCTLDGITISQNENHTFYNPLTCDSQNRFCLTGSLNGSDSYNINDGGSCSPVALYDTTNNLYWDINLSRIGTKQWTLIGDATHSEPTWNESLGIYSYPNALTKSDYPAFESCENLALGGHTDWRLPTYSELLNLGNIEIGGWGQANFETYGFTNYIAQFYWSSNESTMTTAAIVRLINGDPGVSGTKTAITIYVACVRRY